MIKSEYFTHLSARQQRWVDHWHIYSHDYGLAPYDARILYGANMDGRLILGYYGITAEFILITTAGI